MTLNKQSAHHWLESQQDSMVADLVFLASRNSGSYNWAGLLAMAAKLTSWMNLTPAELRSIELPPRREVNDEGKSVLLETGPALRWDFQPQAKRRVLLMIHYDTVFGVDHDFQSCEMLSPTLLRGPGVADAKGGIIVLRYALQSLLKFGLAKELGWTVLLNPDEEVGSFSSAALMREFAPQFDFALLFEPALPNGTFVSHRKGSGNFSVMVEGQAAHAGRYFDRGRNAIAELSRIVAVLDALNGQRAETTINVGSIQGGGPVNVVPDRATAKLNVRAPDKESAMWFEEQLRMIASHTASRNGFACEVQGGFTSPPKCLNAAQLEMMRVVETCSANLSLPAVQWQSTGGVCDGNKLAAAGLPNIDTLGPRGDGLHSNQECVQLDSLAEKAKLVVEILCEFADGKFENLLRDKVPATT